MAQTSADASVFTYSKEHEQTEMFVIDDILAWFWCSITSCKKKEEAPAKATEAPKKQEVEIKKKEAANDTAPSNGTKNSTNSTSSANSGGKTSANAPPAGAASGSSGSGENNDLTPKDDTLDTIKRLKAK